VFQQTRDQVNRVMVGQTRVIEATLTAIFCGGNVLLEGLPGLGKTELVKAISKALDLQFRRIQFTPDLMPADILGTNILGTATDGNQQFEFRPGPIFTQLLLADEINRTPPKTQSALLEAMQERAVTSAGQHFELDRPFFVLATQNPIEQEGTYPLPEAQLDRFLFKVSVPFPTRADLNEILNRTTIGEKIEPAKVLDAAGILEFRQTLKQVVVADHIRDYAVRLVLATHPETPEAPEKVKRFVKWGASPRACQGLINSARVRAITSGRGHVACEDVREYANEVLGHRILLNYDGQAEGVSLPDIVKAAVQSTPEASSKL
jgi:MoxR-like ATPase